MKKGVLIIGILFLAITLPLVSSFFHKKVQESPVDVTVNVAGAPPTIIATYLIIDTDGTGGATDIVTALDGDAGDNINNAEIRFLVEDTNGIDDLPGSIANPFVESTASGQLGIGGVNIEIYATNPGNDYALIDIILDVGSCVRLPTCPDAGGSCPANQMEFSCTVPMAYYFEPGTIGVDPWVMTVGVADGSVTTVNTTRDFTYLSNSHFVMGGGLTWASISLSGTNQLPTGSLDLTNYGNVGYTTGSVHGSELTPDGGATGDDLPISAFAVSVQTGGAECTTGVAADALNNVLVPVTTGGAPNLIYGDGSGGSPTIPGESIYFCIWNNPDNAVYGARTYSESQYSSTAIKGVIAGTPGNAWDVALT